MVRLRPKLAPERRAITDRARNLRTHSTDAERLIWYRVRGGRLAGLKFRRQHPCGPYVADFVCEEKSLVIEIDGGQHASHAARDMKRTKFLEAQGYRVLRFWNNEVLGNLDGVLEVILRAAGKWPP